MWRWWRHLPPEIQEVLSQVKASMQRTIGLVQARARPCAPLRGRGAWEVTGKLANEEIGRRGLRVSDAEHLVYRSRPP